MPVKKKEPPIPLPIKIRELLQEENEVTKELAAEFYIWANMLMKANKWSPNRTFEEQHKACNAEGYPEKSPSQLYRYFITVRWLYRERKQVEWVEDATFNQHRLAAVQSDRDEEKTWDILAENPKDFIRSYNGRKEITWGLRSKLTDASTRLRRILKHVLLDAEEYDDEFGVRMESLAGHLQKAHAHVEEGIEESI